MQLIKSFFRLIYLFFKDNEQLRMLKELTFEGKHRHYYKTQLKKYKIFRKFFLYRYKLKLKRISSDRHNLSSRTAWDIIRDLVLLIIYTIIGFWLYQYFWYSYKIVFFIYVYFALIFHMMVMKIDKDKDFKSYVLFFVFLHIIILGIYIYARMNLK